jgi:hypothetical protein
MGHETGVPLNRTACAVLKPSRECQTAPRLCFDARAASCCVEYYYRAASSATTLASLGGLGVLTLSS